MAGIHPVDNIIQSQKWCWIGHTRRKACQHVRPWSGTHWMPSKEKEADHGSPGGELSNRWVNPGLKLEILPS